MPRRVIERLGTLALALLLLGANWITPPSDVDVVGRVRHLVAGPAETLSDIAVRERLGQDAVRRANPSLPRWLPVGEREVRLPERHVLPAAPREGLVVNLAELALYDYTGRDRLGRPRVAVYPVSVGRPDWPTPLGIAHVVTRRERPAWTPPASIHAEAAARGLTLPSVVPAGPHNPLGNHALYLDWPGFLLHGTNEPEAIGERVTHGCVRLYPEHIANLFERVADGTPVRFVDEPVKVGWFAGRLHLEVHPSTDERPPSVDALLDEALRLVHAALVDAPDVQADSLRIRRAVARHDGLPVDVTRTVRASPSIDVDPSSDRTIGPGGP